MRKTRPCPFCGETSVTIEDDEVSTGFLGWSFEANVVCDGCGAKGPVVGTDEQILTASFAHNEAISEWNDRGPWGSSAT